MSSVSPFFDVSIVISVHHHNRVGERQIQEARRWAGLDYQGSLDRVYRGLPLPTVLALT